MKHYLTLLLVLLVAWMDPAGAAAAYQDTLAADASVTLDASDGMPEAGTLSVLHNGPVKVEIKDAGDDWLQVFLSRTSGLDQVKVSGGEVRITAVGAAVAVSVWVQDQDGFKYLSGSNAAFRMMWTKLDRGEDAAAGFIGDSTFRDPVALPYQFATALAARYPNHRVELRRAANNMQSITNTVVQVGPLGERYRQFGTDATQGNYIPYAHARTSIDGAAAFRIEVAVRFTAAQLTGGYPTGASGGWSYLCGIGRAGNCTRLVINNNGTMYLTVQAAGATSADITTSTAIGAFTAGTWYYFRVDFTANNGSNSVASFYKSTDGTTYNLIGTANRTGTAITPVIASTPVTASTSAYWIGGISAATVSPMAIKRCQWYLGLTTPDPLLPERIDFWTQDSSIGTTKTSTLEGSPTIFIDQAAQDGATLAVDGFFTGSGAGDFATEAYRCWVDHLHDFIQINTSHNDKDISLLDWETYMTAAVTNVLSRPAYKPLIVHTTQNPEVELFAGDELVLRHQRRQGDLLRYAARNNRPCTDINKAFVDADDLAGLIDVTRIHPTTASGYPLWGRTFVEAFFAGRN